MNAVSYTHLDVYKRQPSHNAFLSWVRRLIVDMASVGRPSSGVSSVLYSAYHLPAPHVFLPPHYLALQCPNQFHFVPLMIFSTLLFSSTLPSTSWIVTLSFHEIYSILFHVHILKAYNLLSSSSLNVQVFAPYRSMLQQNNLTSSFTPFFLLRASLAKAVLHFISWLQCLSLIHI